MESVHVIGIDPGLIDTGIVSFMLGHHEIHTRHAVVKGIDVQRVESWIKQHSTPDAVFIEKYRPRSNFGEDTRMVQGERDLRLALPRAKLLENTGVRRTVSQQVLEVLGLWKFDTTSNHQDLRSAARILVLGMLKDEEMNTLLADCLRDHIDGSTWAVRNHGGHVV